MVASKKVLKFILGIKLKQLRLQRGLSPRELADSAGLSLSYLNEIEKGKKYPKVEKLLTLAQVLKVNLEELVSSKMGKTLHPLLKFLESDLFKSLPLKLFGISDQDVYELMSTSPEKFTSFLVTILEIARSYDMKVEDFHKAALRAFQESHNNYFPELEKRAKAAHKKYAIDTPNIESLTQILRKEFDYQIDFDRLTATEATRDIRSLFKPGKPPKLLINKHLSEFQKVFVLARELGAQLLNLTIHPVNERGASFYNFEDILNDYKASYFAGALLIDQDSFYRQLKAIFSQSQFREQDFAALMQQYSVNTEVLLHRMTQILPSKFGLDQLFFLRFTNNYVTAPERFHVSKEIHLSRLHRPHGSFLSEHHCRRWITTSLLQRLGDQMRHGMEPQTLIGAQRSIMESDQSEYFCLSMARNSQTVPTQNIGITIGILADEKFKKQIKFGNDPNVLVKTVSQTCERCPLMDCDERSANPVIFEDLQKRDQRKDIVKELLSTI